MPTTTQPNYCYQSCRCFGCGGAAAAAASAAASAAAAAAAATTELTIVVLSRQSGRSWAAVGGGLGDSTCSEAPMHLVLRTYVRA